MDYRIYPPEEMLEASISLPLSKSICNRLLIINAMTPGAAPLPEIADCDDSVDMARIIADSGNHIGGRIHNVGAAGTALRFLTAWFAATEGSDVVLDGTERLRQRPIGTLVDTLRSIGADIEYIESEGHAPLRIRGRRLGGGTVEMDASVSSQFISAVMMVAPSMISPLTIRLTGELISRPYIIMTKSLMERAGASVEFEGDTVRIDNRPYSIEIHDIERDWSAASYWYEITALSAGFVTLPGLSTDSVQGDRSVARFFRRLGVNTNTSEDTDNALELCPDPEQFSRFEEDLSENPDIAQTIAVTCAMLGIPFHLRGLSTLRIKETDRLAAMQTELDRFGIIVEIRNDSELVWNGERHPIFEIPAVSTYADHRMAMAFAPAALYVPGMIIRDIDVVSKSYPSFWDDLRSAGFSVTDAAIPADDNPTDNK